MSFHRTKRESALQGLRLPNLYLSLDKILVLHHHPELGGIVDSLRWLLKRLPGALEGVGHLYRRRILFAIGSPRWDIEGDLPQAGCLRHRRYGGATLKRLSP